MDSLRNRLVVLKQIKYQPLSYLSRFILRTVKWLRRASILPEQCHLGLPQLVIQKNNILESQSVSCSQ